MDLHVYISNGIVSFEICDKRDDFDFYIVKFSILDYDILYSAYYAVDISQLIRFATVCSHMINVNARNKILNANFVLFPFFSFFFLQNLSPTL